MNGNDRFLNVNDAHLRVTGGNVHASSFNLDQISITTTSTTSSTIDFLNETKAFNARSNIEVGTANLFVDTTTSNVGIHTTSPEYALDVHGPANVSVLTANTVTGFDGTLFLGSHLLPTQHQQFDIGSAEKKIRHLFLSDNSLWIGDESKISVVGGKMKFLKRNKNIVPSGTEALGGNAAGAKDHAGVSNINEMKLEHWLAYTRSLTGGADKDIKDIFTDATANYEATSASDAFKEHGNDIYSVNKLRLGSAAAADATLDVVGTIKATSDLTVNTNTFHVDATNSRVGVGTTNPDYNLHVRGDANGATTIGPVAGMGFVDSGVSFCGIKVGEKGASPYTRTALSVEDNGNTILHVDGHNERVGIGTTTPYEKLHVNGNIRLGGPAGTDEDVSYYIKSAGQIQINAATDGAADDSYICLDLRAGQTGSNRSGIGICGAATSTTFQHIVFETTDAERMRIDHDGHVGIGTSDPGTMLHIETPTGIASNYVRIESGMNNGSAQSISGIEFKTNPQFYNGDNGRRVPAQIRSGFYNGPAGTANWGDAYLSLLTTTSPSDAALTEALTCRTGNVGVGTTTPGRKLEVYTGNGSIPGIRLKRYPTGATYTEFQHADSTAPANSKEGLAIITSDGNATTQEVMRICGANLPGNSGGGTVGIGTTSPNWPLEIVSGNNSITHYGPNSSWGGRLSVGAANDKTASTDAATAQCISTNGNLHLDAAATRDIYLCHYRGTNVQFGSTIIHSSDDRLKSEEELITNATDTLLKLNPQKYKKAYTLREDESREPYTESGLIAQDVWYDAPELRHLVRLCSDANPIDTKPEAPVDGDIQQDPDYSSWGTEAAALNYDGLIAYLIKSNQELHARIQALENAS